MSDQEISVSLEHAAISVAVEAQAGVDGGSPDDVKALFSSAKQNGINVIRFFPFGILEKFTLQTAPGEERTERCKRKGSFVEVKISLERFVLLDEWQSCQRLAEIGRQG